MYKIIMWTISKILRNQTWEQIKNKLEKGGIILSIAIYVHESDLLGLSYKGGKSTDLLSPLYAWNNKCWGKIKVWLKFTTNRERAWQG